MDTPMDVVCDFAGPFWQNSKQHLKIKCNNSFGERNTRKRRKK